MGIKDFFRITDEDGKTIKEMGEKLKGKDLKCLQEMKGLRVVIDAPPIIHAAVRGMPNVDSLMHDGKITSQLNVMFYNALQLKRLGIDQLWVFDGKPPTIKVGELEKRKQARQKAEDAKKKAKAKGDNEKVKKLEKIAYKLEEYIYVDAQRLLTRMGIPWAIAPEEAEAYCSHLNRKGDYDFVYSMDADCFMFGAKQVLRPTKEAGKKIFYMYRRDEILENLGINNRQLVEIGLCLGTDFSEKIRGIGPKTVVKKVKDGNVEFDQTQENAKAYFNDAAKNGNATHKNVQFNKNKLVKFIEKRGFNISRLSPSIEELERLMK